MIKEYSFAAKIYDPLLYFFIRPIRIAVIEILDEYREKSILDLCCGTGDQIKLLSKNGFKNLHCLDMSEAMLKVARKNNSQIKFYQEDATKTSFSDESFDLIIISFAIHEKNRITQKNFIKETYRLIKSDGVILVVDYDFNEKTTKLVKIAINIIERIAGKNHFNNFKNYIKNQGLLSLIQANKFKELKNKKKTFKGVSIFLYQKNY